MATDKELALRMLEAIENLYIENAILKTMLDRASGPAWKRSFTAILANPDPGAVAQLRSRFDPLRAVIQQDRGLEQAIQEFLRVVPPKKDVN
jgi:hypothetical protein